MARTLATDVFVDDVRYLAGSTDVDLAKVSTDVPSADGKKPAQVSVADRITNPLAWVTDGPTDSAPVTAGPATNLTVTAAPATPAA
jgi:hypothetical protein